MKSLILIITFILLIFSGCKKSQPSLNQTSSAAHTNTIQWHLKQKSNMGTQLNLLPFECLITMDTALRTLTVSGFKASVFLPPAVYAYTFKDSTELHLNGQGMWFPYTRKLLQLLPKKHSGMMVFSEWQNGLQIVMDESFGIADDEFYFVFNKI